MRNNRVYVLAVILMAINVIAQAGEFKTLARHEGKNDPVQEGWRLGSSEISTDSGEETISGKKFTYWSVSDLGAEDGEYKFPLSVEEMSRPWRITLIARLVDTNAESTGYGIALHDGNHYWRLNLNKDGVYYDNASGGADRFGTAIDTTASYHRYDLILDPGAPSCGTGSGRVTLLVDGKVHAELSQFNFRRFRIPHGITFGSTSSGGIGTVRYHLVEFAVGKKSAPVDNAEQDVLQENSDVPVRRLTDEGPWEIGHAKQLFIDHRFIEESKNIQLRVNPPVKRPEPALRSDKPWDAFNLIYYSIAKDGDVYKMWYQAYDKDQWGAGRPRMCYAVSPDGLNWEKPSLGLVEYNGSTDNNILLKEQSKLGFVFIDPQGTPEQRFKMLSGIGTTHMRTSPDGIHWTDHPQVVWSPPWDTQKQAWWDPRIGRYVIHTRVVVKPNGELTFPFAEPIESNPPVVAPQLHRPTRALGRVEVDDIMQPWPMEETLTILTSDEQDPPVSDIYHPGGVYQYPYASDAYLMFPLTYQHFRPGEGHSHNDGVNDTQFAASRNGINWMRYDRQPFIPRGLPGDPDHGDTHASNYFIRQGNYLYQYYRGWPWSHGGYRTLSSEDRKDRTNWGRAFVGVVVHRLDGFVSADAPQEGGYLVTPPLLFDGHCLELNIDVSGMGGALVEIQDESGQPISGYTLDDCDRILQNDVAYVVHWKGNPDVSWLAGKPVRLKIALRSSKLFAFQFNGN